MGTLYISKSFARILCPKRTKPDKTTGNPVERALTNKRRRDALTSLHRSEAIKKKWQDPEYRAKKLPQVRRNLLQFQEANTEEERKAKYAKQVETVEKMLATQNVMAGSYVMRFMQANCSEVEIEPNMPLGYYEEMLEFFHPELVWKLQKEWEKDFAGYIKK